MINKEKTPTVKGIEKNGKTGANALWDGPLDMDGFPMGDGSSSGKNGMEVLKYPTNYIAGPITQRAKGRK
jgi:hypothetical protein